MLFSSVAALLALLIAGPATAAQRGSQTPPPAPSQVEQQMPPGEQPVSAGQIQRWFEAYAVLQAQDRLQLSETQYGRFVTRFRALQETRRKHQQTHQVLLNDLRKLTNPQTGSNEESAITERLKALKEEDAAAAGALAKAYEGVDETLDTRQQARFRIFEDQVEQQKLELLMRARQNARAAARGKKDGGSPPSPAR